MIYANGLELSIWPASASPNYAAWEASFQTVNVHGSVGGAAEPGFQKVEGDRLQPYPASVSWWENGLVINLYGNFPLAELLKMAESVSGPPKRLRTSQAVIPTLVITLTDTTCTFRPKPGSPSSSSSV